ncbi:MAG TPA: transglycosylase domain-containing protein, partial [Sphingomicrobium sp.]|nr:transglycosylase domain-containing protein [Sphingomicrobium sp.]
MADDHGPGFDRAHGIWQRSGADIENLPDPFGRTAQPDEAAPPPGSAKPRRSWLRWGFNIFGALLLVTLIWLIVTAPLSRALEPLDDPAMLLVSAEGRPIARRGAVKDEPVDATRLDPLTPAAFISIEDRRFRSHWGIDPRAIGRAMVANIQAGGVR